MNYNAIGTRENVKVIDTSECKSMKIEWNIMQAAIYVCHVFDFGG